ncbi:YciI family protein [Ktedonosporobacter rubrisoli]|nr:YciI family protein [Ktedonosporobacter rubrisoli]
MKKTFATFFVPGPAWIAGKTSREQPYWTEHAAFLDKLFADGMVILGGPFANYSDLLVIIEADTEEQVHSLFKQDPFVLHNIIRVRAIREWLLFLDARRRA